MRLAVAPLSCKRRLRKLITSTRAEAASREQQSTIVDWARGETPAASVLLDAAEDLLVDGVVHRAGLLVRKNPPFS